MADKQAVAEIVGKLGWAYDENHLDYFAEVFADDGRFTMSIAGQGQVGERRAALRVIIPGDDLHA